jgi:PAS domain S-box-containing protein
MIDLSPAANILFASESILDILGYQPFEVIGKSCYEYFHKDDVPFNRYRHNDAIELDKAAVIHYARIRAKSGEWVSCECVFTVVHNVLVACTSIYKDMLKHMSERPARLPSIRSNKSQRGMRRSKLSIGSSHHRRVTHVITC